MLLCAWLGELRQQASLRLCYGFWTGGSVTFFIGCPQHLNSAHPSLHSHPLVTWISSLHFSHRYMSPVAGEVGWLVIFSACCEVEGSVETIRFEIINIAKPVLRLSRCEAINKIANQCLLSCGVLDLSTTRRTNVAAG